MDSIRNHSFSKVQNGKADNIEDFFKQIIEPQFKNKEAICTTHKSLMNYLNEKSPTFFLRLYGSASKDQYNLLRRGFLSVYPSGLKMVFCDNTFAMLFAALKWAGIPYSKGELEALFDQPEKLICSFGSTKEEKELRYYNPNELALKVNLNSKGWYLAHIKPVGKGFSHKTDSISKIFPRPDRSEWVKENRIRNVEKDLSDNELEILKAHFIRLIHPLNSFLVPKRNHVLYKGKNLGEEKELLYFVQNYLRNEFPEEYREFDNLSLKYNMEKDYNPITHIEWFKEPQKIRKTKAIKAKQDNIETDTVEELSINLDRWLNSIGKKAFVEAFYPYLKENINITKYELKEQNTLFASWKTQQQRLSTARSIFINGLEREALQIIVDSKANLETRKKAEDYLNEI